MRTAASTTLSWPRNSDFVLPESSSTRCAVWDGSVQRRVLKDMWIERTNVIHRTGNKKFALGAWEGAPDPVSVRTNNLNAVSV
jgi:hypothetical protein